MTRAEIHEIENRKGKKIMKVFFKGWIKSTTLYLE